MILETFHCGEDLQGAVQVFTLPHDGVRLADVFVMKRSLARQKIAKHSDFFRLLLSGVENPSLPKLLDTVETAERSSRFRGYGLLFGYPSSAVEFFVRAAETEDQTGAFVPRQFVSIPTHISQTGQFVWAVPVGHVETSEEVAIRSAASRILEQYRLLRKKWIGSKQTSADSIKSLELIREWYHDGDGDYSSDYARY